MRYADFTIEIVPDGERHTARVIASPDGEASATFQSPFTEYELLRFNGVPEERERASSSPRLLGAEKEDGASTDPAEVGRRLFDALFHGQIRTRFERSWGRLLEHPAKGLRIKIRFETTDPRTLSLARLPWELLYPDADTGFLCLSRRTPVVRYLAVADSAAHGPLPTTFRILVASAEPRGTTPLELGKEARLLAAMCRGSGIELDYLPHATARGLEDRLRERSDEGSPYHAIHFMGHGGLDGSPGEGSLLLEDGAGNQDRVTGSVLRQRLKDLPDLRFAFLNACYSGAAPAGRGPLASVGASLVRGGLSAVVAMQRAVRDEEAVLFAGELYARLARGEAVDAALTEARISLFNLDPGRATWAAPILLMQTHDGSLFASDPELGGAWVLEKLDSRPGREFPPVLDEAGDEGGPWVLAAHVGPSLVIGRCHAPQLRAAALQRLRQTGDEVVHWVVCWDDARLPQLMARLAWDDEGRVGSLLVENLTDYSSRPSALILASGGFASEPLAPGKRRRFPGLSHGQEDLSIWMAEEPTLELMRLGAGANDLGLWALVTRDVRFTVPNRQPSVSQVRFLGLWLPMTLRFLRERLESFDRVVAIPLSAESPGRALQVAMAYGRPILRLERRSHEDISSPPGALLPT